MLTVFGFYKFKKINDLKKKQKILNNLLDNKNIYGSIIISKEGLNGSISGKNKDIKDTIIRLKKILSIKEFDSFNNSKSKFKPFHKAKVKIKKEVVPMDLKMSNIIKKKNTHIDPIKWNELIKNNKTILLDARKPFEYKVGSFKKSVNPNIGNFRDFPKYLKKLKKDQPIAMFCTGGIRCEKSTKFLLKDGVKNVYHLKGGILNYLKSQKDKNSLWQGECFVFDQRVSVDENLNKGKCILCHACREPLTPEDLENFKYEEGVSCPYCFYKTNDFKKNNFRERQKQIRLSFEKGEKHLKHF